MPRLIAATLGAALLLLLGCGATQERVPVTEDPLKAKLARYATVRLELDNTPLTPAERRMLRLFREAAQVMDELFWLQAYGDKQELLRRAASPAQRRYLAINYGPWDRLDNNRPFLDGFGPKPPGANFYPPDMTKEEWEAAVASSPEAARAFTSLYTLIRRDANRNLIAVPYHLAFAPQLEQAAARLREAASLAADPALARYLRLRADALLTDHYQPSDFAWMEMKHNTLDLVIGPIETYEDKLFGYKAAYEAYVLVKDQDWSRRLQRYAAFLPALQRALPVPPAYKRESPGADADLNAYTVLYYAGDCNAGSKTIAINLPNDEEVQLKKGTRRLQLKNAMRAKFDAILLPLARRLIDPAQQKHIQFDAFFTNVMFHEVAHGLGIKNTINGRGPVRQALKDKASALEEGKADVLGLYMVTRLARQGELPGANLMDHYVTFLAGIFRSVRFGAATAHGVANALQLNYLLEQGAFRRLPAGGFTVDPARMEKAITSLAATILRLQGDGDYNQAATFLQTHGTLPADLHATMESLHAAAIPVDVVFEQGDF